jgi:hypothetical protein
MILLQRQLGSETQASLDQMHQKNIALLDYVIQNERTLFDKECQIFSPQTESFLNSVLLTKYVSLFLSIDEYGVITHLTSLSLHICDPFFWGYGA